MTSKYEIIGKHCPVTETKFDVHMFTNSKIKANSIARKLRKHYYYVALISRRLMNVSKMMEDLL